MPQMMWILAVSIAAHSNAHQKKLEPSIDHRHPFFAMPASACEIALSLFANPSDVLEFIRVIRTHPVRGKGRALLSISPV
jgi:hypothetical protein